VVGRPGLLALILSVALVAMAQPAAAAPSTQVTARLGISAGAAIEDAPLGLGQPDLRQRIPILFETAYELDVQIESVSVGQGFFTDEGVLLSEKDLDLVVTGSPERIAAMAATLGKAFDQSLVFVWFFDPEGAQATAAIPLPGGAEALTTEHYELLVMELADGGHVLYAGEPDLIYVANTGDEPEPAFAARMERVRVLLDGMGIPTGPVRCERAHFLALDRESYDQHIAGASVQPTLSGAGDQRHPEPVCFTPDEATGTPHVFLGMWSTFTVH
jgi:hypothetical protein